MGDIRALLFDFGGTLDGPTHWLDRFLAQYGAAGIDISRSELDPAFDHATRTGYGATRILARFGMMDLVRFLVGHQFEFLRQNGPDRIRPMLESGGAKVRHRIVEAVSTSFVRDTTAGLEHGRSVLQALGGRFKLGVVSNFYGNLDGVLAEAKMDRFLAAVVDSSRAGVFKPDPRIFQLAIDKLRVTTEEIAIIGDSLTKDCKPAKQLGLRTVWLCTESAATLPDDTEGIADVTIRSIDELLALEW
jgi:putative hydrolase of the HAD superfamily